MWKIFSSVLVLIALFLSFASCSPGKTEKRDGGSFKSTPKLNSTSHCEKYERDPTATVTREDVLQLCCELDDGIERDCCSLIYPDVPKRVRVCHCNCTSKPPMKKLEEDDWWTYKSEFERDAKNGCVFPKESSESRDILHRKCSLLRGQNKIDCLALLYPSIPWNKRCFDDRYGTNNVIEDLHADCCRTNPLDGVQRDCCALIYSNLNEAQLKRFCPSCEEKLKKRNKDDEVETIDTEGGSCFLENKVHPESLSLFTKCCSSPLPNKDVKCGEMAFDNSTITCRCRAAVSSAVRILKSPPPRVKLDLDQTGPIEDKN